MIICLTHGSSNEKVNSEQSNVLTKAIKAHYQTQIVKTAYYSQVVNRRLQKKQVKVDLVETLIEANYETEEYFIVVLTTLINGIERKRIVDKINQVDPKQKVKIIDPLLVSKNFEALINLFKEQKDGLLLIAHGNQFVQNEYTDFEAYLQKNAINCKLITLKDEIDYTLIKEQFKQEICVFPLMMIKAHHTKFDIEQKIIPELEINGLSPKLVTEPLIKSKIIIDHYLKEIEIKMSEVLK